MGVTLAGFFTLVMRQRGGQRQTETERRQAAVKDQNRKDGNILVLFAAADGEFLLHPLKFW